MYGVQLKSLIALAENAHHQLEIKIFARQRPRAISKSDWTGVTSYLPTLPSQRPEIYHKALPHLAPSDAARNPLEGSESLGAHCEGPFLAPTKNGIHTSEVLQEAPNGFADLEACYGAENLPSPGSGVKSPITKITAAPEISGITASIPEGIIYSRGHTETTYEQASAAIKAGATMAMRPLHHRNPGIFGMLGKSESKERPYFGIISDGIQLHPTTVNIAWNAHPDGFILITDAMKTVALPDGVYDWPNGDRWVKKGPLLTREGTDTIAGSRATLMECVSNFWTWSRAPIAEVLRAVTSTPAAMLGIEKVKGTLEPDADADLVVMDAVEHEDGRRELSLEQTWKFGMEIHDERFGL